MPGACSSVAASFHTVSTAPYTVLQQLHCCLTFLRCWCCRHRRRRRWCAACGAGAAGACACWQVCLFDLDYGLPVQVRDTALGIEKEEIPESDVGKEFQLNEQIQRGQTESAFGGGGRPNDLLQQLARTTPYYKVWQEG